MYQKVSNIEVKRVESVRKYVIILVLVCACLNSSACSTFDVLQSVDESIPSWADIMKSESDANREYAEKTQNDAVASDSTVEMTFRNYSDTYIIDENLTDKQTEDGYLSVTVNGDGTATYRINKADRIRLLNNFKVQVPNIMSELTSAYDSVHRVLMNSNFTEVILIVNRELFEGGDDSAIIWDMSVQAGWYHMLAGTDLESKPMTVKYEDVKSSEVYAVKTFPKDFVSES